MARGRKPMLYDAEVADLICERLILGQSLHRICASKDFPSLATVMKWLRSTLDFAQQYARAREEQADTLADQIVELADTATARNAQAIRVRVDARKWVASKLKPRKYSDRLIGSDGGPLSVEIVKFAARELTDEQLNTIVTKGSREGQSEKAARS